MKSGQLIECSNINIFLQKSCRKWGRETTSKPLFFLKKLSLKERHFVCSFPWLYYISIALRLAYNKNNLYKTSDHWSRDILNFDFLEKDLGIVSPPHFVYDFSTKMFLMLCSINWPNFIVWLPLLLEILGNTCIAIVC